jgi:predicted enzyme related to lactoylglutathione lyase
MSRVIHFELGAVNPGRAVKFYQHVFGWEAMQFPGPEEYWLMKTGADDQPGINGGIMRHKDSMPRTVNTIQVQSIEEFGEKVKKNGGQVVVEKMAIPGVGYQAYCQDTEGNIFGIHQSDQTAK